MSDNFLILIPTDPQFVPSPDRAQAANDYLLSLLPEAEDIIWSASDDATFVDCGNHFERLTCPACGTELTLTIWQQMMDAAYAANFSDLGITLPCCGTNSSLNDLHYHWPAGFARFSLEALNPNADIDDNQIHTVENILGCPVRKIWRSL